MKVYAFDFDGTLTKEDTFLAFIEYAKGYGKTFWGFFLFSPILVAMKLKLFPNWKAKQMMFSWFFKGMDIDEFDKLCHEFADKNQQLIRTGGWDTIRKALTNGDQVIIITASIENWVKPFFKDFGGQIRVEGTKIDVRTGQVTGQFLTQNCYGIEKTKRLKEVFPYRQAYQLIAFGDSNGDRYLLAEADERYYKPFRGENTDKIGEFLRFGFVGIVATAIQYGFYLLLIKWLQPQLSNTVGYIISFIFNYITSTTFTFKVKSTAKKGAGFAFSHLINYLLQIGFLTLFLWFGLPKNIALIPVFCICVPINFLLVRLFLKKK